jgi:hypothetical protein
MFAPEVETVGTRMTPGQAELIRLLMTSESYRAFTDIIEKEIALTMERLENIANPRDDDMIAKGAVHSMRWVLQIVDEAEGVVLREEAAAKGKQNEHIEQTGLAE